MSGKLNPALNDPEIRRAFEEEFLFGEATDTLAGLIASLGISQRELAHRLGVSPGRVSQILSGEENLTLRSFAALGWALGVRFGLNPVPMADRAGTPAAHDPPAPAWLGRPGAVTRPRFQRLDSVTYQKHEMRESALRVVHGEVRAAA